MPANIYLILPYVVWMALMALLPATGWAYAVRSAACALCLVPCAAAYFRKGRPTLRQIAIGLAGGIAVWAIWVLPELSALYREWLIIGGTDSAAPSPYDPAVCGWALTIARLCGSAFIIAAAEELFFRRWLYNWLGADKTAFFWMVVLFAIEHNRPVVAAAAGAIYGWLAIRRGLASAIIAHMTTNLVLGLQVIITKNWAFW